MGEPRYPEYDGQCENYTPVPSNPQAPQESARKSPEVPRPVSKRNKPSISGSK